MKLTPQQLKTVDYTSVFRSKTTFRIGFKKWMLPYTFVLEDIIIYIASLVIIRQLFGQIIDMIGGFIMFGKYAISFVLPYLAMRAIKQLPTDGKPIYLYLWDIVRSYFTVILPKKALYKGNYIEQPTDEPQDIVFKKE